MRHRYVLSLFSSAGIGELGVKAAGLKILLSNELLESRCELYKENFPETESICGDIWSEKEKIIKTWQSYGVGEPYMIYATPPCQGMSFNGIGKLLSEIRAGRRPKEDPRNRLIIPTVDIIKTLRPQWVILENVPTMENTIIRLEDNTYRNIIEFIREELSDEYILKAEKVNCADFGIPQTRIRLITILCRSPKGKMHYQNEQTYIPARTHSETCEDGLLPWVTLKESIGHLPTLEAERGHNENSTIPWHIVPIMKPEKLWWVRQTPMDETAYNNQCVACGCKTNPNHGMCFINGIHQSKKDTPIYCNQCGALLPRPTMIDKKTGKRRLIKGFDSAYRRMSWDAPAPTLTQNFQYEASDKKLHPSQNRVLSVYEGLIIQSIKDYSYKFEIKGKKVNRNQLCKVIGESVPPKLIEILCNHILSIDQNNDK